MPKSASKPSYKITNKIAPPKRDPKRFSGDRKLPLASLKVGQSFAIQLGPPSERVATRRAAASAVHRYARANNLQFQTKSEDDGASLRIWRVK